MRAMVNDISHPCVDFNGVLLQLYAMNTSGNNITVQINCIANSLYTRMGYYGTGNTAPFRTRVAMTTYGDDMKGSVHPSVRETFNFLVMREFLAKYDVKITPPDKKSEGEKFFSSEKLDFLKRKSFYVPEVSAKLGQLEESSIFKSLHCNLYSKKACAEDIASSCIETALHEWFAFGRDHYNLRLSQMAQVCADVGLELPVLQIGFDERVQKWKEKYDSGNTDNDFTSLKDDEESVGDC